MESKNEINELSNNNFIESILSQNKLIIALNEKIINLLSEPRFYINRDVDHNKND